MKNKLSNFLKYIPGYRSGKNKTIATMYYGIFLAMVLVPFIASGKIEVVNSIFAMIFILVPFLIVGFKKIFKGTKEEKLIYFIYPVIFIVVLIFGMNKYDSIYLKSKDKALQSLGVTSEKYNYELEKYNNENKKLSDNKALIDSGEYTYEELSSRYNSLKAEYSNLKVQNDKKLQLYNDLKSAKEEKDRKDKLAKEKAEKEAVRKEAEKQENKTNIANKNSTKNSNKNNSINNFKVKDGIANHNSSSGYNSPTKDPNRPVATSAYGYVAEGNNYIHKTPNCKFLKGKSAQKVSVDSSGKYKCNCWRY